MSKAMASIMSRWPKAWAARRPGPKLKRVQGRLRQGADADGGETVKPLFELMGKNITLVGSNGDGQTAKVANQIIVALNIEHRGRGRGPAVRRQGRSRPGAG